MKPAPFKYAAAASVAEALSLKAEYGDAARFLAGGQSLIAAANFRLAQPEVLIDINALDELALVRPQRGALSVGAMTRYRTLERDALIAERQTLISEALPHIAHPQIRNRGTLGGNLSHADPVSELPAIMVTVGARLRAQSVHGVRWIDAGDFFVGPLTTSLAPEEMLVEIELPDTVPNTGTCFIEVARRRGDFALLGAAAMLSFDVDGKCLDARLSFCGAGGTPVSAAGSVRVLVGGQVTDQLIDAAAAAARASIDPPGSIHASPDFQRHLAQVLTRRSLRTARDRAMSGLKTTPRR